MVLETKGLIFVFFVSTTQKSDAKYNDEKINQDIDHMSKKTRYRSIRGRRRVQGDQVSHFQPVILSLD